MKQTLKNARLRDLGEDGVIRLILHKIAPISRSLVGPGDDCAVARMPGSKHDLLIKSDPLIEGVHFLPTAAPKLVGHKALARVLSDIAAMGGMPDYVVVNVGAPPDYPVARLLAVYDGMAALCRKYGFLLVGGDLARNRCLSLNVAAVGHVPRNSAVRRSGAKVGDLVFVTGLLGHSMDGKHLSFTPRLREGEWLRHKGYPTAMMDLSDGLACDLPRLARASNVGVEILLPAIPCAGRQNDRNKLKHALSDGEDYELLFTVSRCNAKRLMREWGKAFKLPLTKIGRVVAAKCGIVYKDSRQSTQSLKYKGFSHFE